MTSAFRQRKGRNRGTGVALILCCLLSLLPASLQAEDAYQIKAAFLYNFTKFVTWPADMEQQGGDLRLCIFNSNPFGEYLYQLSGRKVRNFELKVIQPANVGELESCAILFLAGAPDDRSQLLKKLAARPILTVSDQEDFAVAGGAIELLSENNRIRFDVNLQTVRDSGLKMSSKLLQLARQVR